MTRTKFIWLVKDYSRNISVKLFLKHLQYHRNKCHFSHYKSMETLSCHSNESTWAMTIKNIIYVEANVMNMYAKFQLHPPYSWGGEDFLIFFRKFTLYQSNSAIWTKFIWIIEEYSRNISVKKKNLNTCSETAKIANFHFSHYKSMETISFHSNQNSYPIGTKNIIIRPPSL